MAILAEKKKMMEKIQYGTRHLKFFLGIGWSVSQVRERRKPAFISNLVSIQLKTIARTVLSVVDFIFKVYSIPLPKYLTDNE